MDGTSEAMTHLTTGAAVVYGIEWLKQWPALSWISGDSKRLNRVLSALAAALLAFGINWTGDAATGWTINVPALAVLSAGAWEWVKQLMLQQLLYDGIAQKSGAKA